MEGDPKGFSDDVNKVIRDEMWPNRVGVPSVSRPTPDLPQRNNNAAKKRSQAQDRLPLDSTPLLESQDDPPRYVARIC